MIALHSPPPPLPNLEWLEHEAIWEEFAALIVEACGAQAAAVAWLDGARIRLAPAVGTPPADLIFKNARQAQETLEISGALACSGVFKNVKWSAVTSETFRTPDGRVLGALCLFNDRPRTCSQQLLSRFARHAEALYEQALIQSEALERSDEERFAPAREIERARDVAEAASAAKDEFIAKLSHELRTPLTPALMTVGMLLDRHDLCPQLREDLALVHRNIELEARLIDDLLDVTRIVNGKLDLQLEQADVHRLLEEASDICRTHSRERRVHINLRLGAPDRFILCDRVRVEQVFWNLLHNAVKFSPPGSSIEVHTSNPYPGQIEINVRDHGIGIHPTKIGSLFNAFEQGENGVSRQFGGLGLGLAICKGVVDLHNGNICATSNGPGCGSTFSVQLGTVAPIPRASHSGGLSELASSSGEEAPHRAAHVLLVEDHEHAAEILSRLLRRAGHSVEVAHCVADAKHLFQRHDFDLLVSDIGLPDGTGLDLMEYIRGHRPTIGIALSGYGTEQDIAASLAAGFVEHVIKPVEWKRLDAVIRKVRESAAV